jgi:DNA-binding NarL/FixJ family response regulator
MRVLLATPDDETLALMQVLLEAALQLVPLTVEVHTGRTPEQLLERARLDLDDIVLLDWPLAGADSPDLVRTVFQINPRLRVIALLPDHPRQYRQCLWEAGACSSIPKERLDQEWISSALCLMNRAMQREARLLELRTENREPRTENGESRITYHASPIYSE